MKRYHFPYGIIQRLAMCWRAVALVFPALLLGAANPCSATSLFVSGGTNNMLYRYDVEPTGTPTLSTSIATSNPAGIVFGPTGELFVANFSTSTVSRFLDPLGTLVPNGVLAGLYGPEYLLFRQNELFVVNQFGGNIVRFAFDTAQNASPNGVITGLGTNERGIAWNSVTDELFVTLCCGSNRIKRFIFDASGHASPNGTITGGGLSNPHVMAFSPWGELFVANSFGDNILRFSFDTLGDALLSGTITGNGLEVPVALSFSPWGELFVGNQTSLGLSPGTVSRWTFDAAHEAIPNGSFTTPAIHLNGVEFAPSAAIPEPSSLALVVIGTVALTSVFAKRRRPFRGG